MRTKRALARKQASGGGQERKQRQEDSQALPVLSADQVCNQENEACHTESRPGEKDEDEITVCAPEHQYEQCNGSGERGEQGRPPNRTPFLSARRRDFHSTKSFSVSAGDAFAKFFRQPLAQVFGQAIVQRACAAQRRVLHRQRSRRGHGHNQPNQRGEAKSGQ